MCMLISANALGQGHIQKFALSAATTSVALRLFHHRKVHRASTKLFQLVLKLLYFLLALLFCLAWLMFLLWFFFLHITVLYASIERRIQHSSLLFFLANYYLLVLCEEYYCLCIILLAPDFLSAIFGWFYCYFPPHPGVHTHARTHTQTASDIYTRMWSTCREIMSFFFHESSSAHSHHNWTKKSEEIGNRLMIISFFQIIIFLFFSWNIQ